MLTDLLSRDVVVLTPATGVDRYGNTVATWNSPGERTVKAWWAQQSATEDKDHRDATITSGLATFDLTAAVAAGERVVIDGVTYEVVGQPNVAHTPRGPHHLEATLVAVDG